MIRLGKRTLRDGRVVTDIEPSENFFWVMVAVMAIIKGVMMTWH